MKQILSIEQMQNLQSLGVDTSKASTVLLFFDENGDNVGWEVENNGTPGSEPLYESWNDDTETWDSTHKEYFDAETGSYDHSYREDCGVFGLQDILEILPKLIVQNNSFLDIRPNIIYSELCVSYVDTKTNETIEVFRSDNLIDAAYKMLCWCAENGYLKGGSNG